MRQRDAMRFLHMGCGESLQTSRMPRAAIWPLPVEKPVPEGARVKPVKGRKNHEGQR
jgi:hypothetical protein